MKYILVFHPYGVASRTQSAPGRLVKAQIARNSWLLRAFSVTRRATQKVDILGARYEFMNRLEIPL